MVDQVSTPVVAKSNQGVVDTMTAVMRLLLVILSTAPAAALFVKKGDLIGLYDYFHTNQGAALLAAVTGLMSLLYGIYKSYKRGAQIATVAASPAVPPTVATLK